MSEENKALVRRLYDAINSGDMQAFTNAASESFVEHEALPGFPATRDGSIQFLTALRAAFPDFRMDIRDMIAEGDKVSVLVTMTGTHKGDFMGIPATGKQINVPASDLLRIEDGKIAEHWGVTDNGAMMQQLGTAG